MKISKLVLSAVCLMLLTGCQSNESMLIKKFPEQENIISSLSDELVGNIADEIKNNDTLSFEEAYEKGFYNTNGGQLSYTTESVAKNVNKLLKSNTDGTLKFPELNYEEGGSCSAVYTVYIGNEAQDAKVRFIVDSNGYYMGFAIDFENGSSLEQFSVLAKYILMGGTGQKYDIPKSSAERAIKWCIDCGQYTISNDYKLYVLNGSLFMFTKNY